MGRPKSSLTTNMRVPISFDLEVKKLTHKYNYKNKTDFLENELTPLLSRIDFISDPISNMFSRQRKHEKK